MTYEKATANVIEFERMDVVVASGCEAPQAIADFDAQNCDGQTQAVSKGGF